MINDYFVLFQQFLCSSDVMLKSFEQFSVDYILEDILQ